MCSVKLSNLPKRYNYSALLELVPDMVACRVFYDPISRKPKNYVYVELSSNEIALKCVNKVNNKEFQVEEAIAAVDEKQGCVIRGRRVSVHFCPKKVKSKIIGLVVYGLKKTTTEDEVRALFPQASKVEMYPLGGFAVLHYALIEDCKLDKKNAMGAELKKRKLKIVFKFQSGNHEEMRPEAITEAKQKNPSPLIFVKNLGRYAILDCKSVIAAKRILAKSYVFEGRTLVVQPASGKKFELKRSIV
ncbi:hypothetical protein EGR_00085 [Echinococcus granulosus]|uniref:RRM domain-containing protein n=1 Tax=Echinococcus granulosus TaxID=6210 RepID=W6UW22_ECHGR|nr:hypothetical protein EGR_00085 [Echinococcus granulosus]EUB64816.1 hypothetical protein EGR_00085 [Echinococcus granulosus]